MNDTRALSLILNSIHDLTLTAESMQYVQQQFCDMTGAVGIHFVLFDQYNIPIESAVFSGLGSDFAMEAADAYLDHYAAQDIKRVQNYFSSAAGRVISNEELTSSEDKKWCPLYNEYFPAYDSEEQLVFGTILQNGLRFVLSQARPKGVGDYGIEERTMFDLLSNQLISAMSRRHDFLSNHQYSDSLTDLITHSRHALILLGRAGRLSWMNKNAEALIKELASISHVDGKIVLNQFPERASLEKLISQATELTRNNRERIGSTVATMGDKILSIDVFSLKQDSILNVGSENKVLLAIRSPDSVKVKDPALVGQHFDLTPAETRLAAAIASGKSIKEYAQDVGIKESTVRDTIKIVMHKADVQRQTNLAIKIKALF